MEKKEIKIPRFWVYFAAFVSGVVMTTLIGLLLGVSMALTFVTNALVYGTLFIASYNVWDKVDKQRYRLTWKYWTLIGLIVASDFMFAFTAMADTKDKGIIGASITACLLVITGCFAWFIYAPSQKEIFAQIREASKMQIKAYLEEHAGEEAETVAAGLLELMLAPKAKEEAPEGEEVDE